MGIHPGPGKVQTSHDPARPLKFMAHAHHSHTLTPVVHGLAAISWGAVPVWFYASDRLHHYLKGPFQIYALIGGLGLIVLGAFCILTARQGASACCGHDHAHEDDEHVHQEQNPWATLLLMIIPVLAGVGLTKDDFSAEFVERRSRASSAQSLDRLFASLPPYTRETLERNTQKDREGNYLVALPQLFWSGSDEEMREVLDGIPVALEGKITREAEDLDPKGRRLRLYKLMMTCCAADAAVIGLPIEFENSPPEFPSGQWVKVTGAIAYETVEEEPTAFIKVKTIFETDPPPPATDPRLRW